MARLHGESFSASFIRNFFFFLLFSPPLLHPRFSVMCSCVSWSLVAQHGMRESGLYQLIHLQGSSAPRMENLDWSSEPLRSKYMLIFNLYVTLNCALKKASIKECD
ncbi:hypothetical protein GOODEAATRI_011144 [Goodea atripinnis]|uniref:Secreted protein n=1 Tax=Goodea atripinnis TaxID=208336 RepID=A0ABV0NJB6_9TELE